MDFLYGPTPHDDAIDFIKSKPAVSRQVFNGLLPELRPRAFVVTGVEGANVLQGVRDRIADLPAGHDWDAIKKDIVNDISPFLVDPHETDPEKRDGQINAANRRAELLLRTHGFQAYQVSAHEVMERQKDVLPFWQYLSMEDDRVRPEHAALDKLILPADDPFWDGHTGPWDFGCRCQKVALSQEERDDQAEQDQKVAPDQRQVLEGPLLARAQYEVVRDGRRFDTRTPVQKGTSTYTFNPNTLRLPLAALQARYDAPVWAEFERWARATAIQETGDATVWGWLKGEELQPAPTAPRTSSKQSPAGAMFAVLKAAEAKRSEIAAKLDTYCPSLSKSRWYALFNSPTLDFSMGLMPSRYREFSALKKELLDHYQGVVAQLSIYDGAWKFDATPRVRDVARSAGDYLRRVAHPSLAPVAPIKVACQRLKSSILGHWNPLKKTIVLNSNFRVTVSTVVHEAMHEVESRLPRFTKAEAAFLGKRAKEAPMETVGHGRTSYRVWPDKWELRGGRKYSGRVYPGQSYREIMSTGIERLHDDPIDFAAKDPEFCRFVLAMIHRDWSKP